MGDTMRSFVAISLPETARRALRRAQDKLKRSPGSQACRWVQPECIHLTLKFLGDIPADDPPLIVAALERQSGPQAPFELTLTGLGCFPNPQRPRVVWIGIGGDVALLSQLQRSVEQALNELGYPPEGRPFSPHLTLARVRDGARRSDVAALGQTIGSSSLGEVARIRVAHLALMRSELRPGGPIYTELARVDLRGGG